MSASETNGVPGHCIASESLFLHGFRKMFDAFVWIRVSDTVEMTFSSLRFFLSIAFWQGVNAMPSKSACRLSPQLHGYAHFLRATHLRNANLLSSAKNKIHFKKRSQPTVDQRRQSDFRRLRSVRFQCCSTSASSTPNDLFNQPRIVRITEFYWFFSSSFCVRWRRWSIEKNNNRQLSLGCIFIIFDRLHKCILTHRQHSGWASNLMFQHTHTHERTHFLAATSNRKLSIDSTGVRGENDIRFHALTCEKVTKDFVVLKQHANIY